MFGIRKKISGFLRKRNSVTGKIKPIVVSGKEDSRPTGFSPEHKHRTHQKSSKKKHLGKRHQPQGIFQASKVELELPKLTTVPAHEEKTRFSDLDIEKPVLCGLQDLEFKYCTPIQEQGLPPALHGKDITGKAQTGTGKTATFLIAAYNKMLRDPRHKRKAGTCRMLVLAPTRELAIQIYNDAEAIGKYCNFENLVVFGGMDHKKQQEALRKPIDILVGTPGRLIDYIRSRHLLLNSTEVLVIDEADRMLDMGFIPDVSRIINRLPPAGKRQTMLFSATLTPQVSRLAGRWLVEPVTIESEAEQLVTDLIDQKFYSVPRDQKLALLLAILKQDDVQRMLIFVNRRDMSIKLVNSLRKYGVKSEVLSGDIPQKKRLKILEEFKSGKNRIIVATDVASRGIHVENITHVINYDIPNESENYIHRIGRTGRAGVKGTSISFVCEYGAYDIQGIEDLLGYEVKCVVPEESMLKLPKRNKRHKNRGKMRSDGKQGKRPGND